LVARIILFHTASDDKLGWGWGEEGIEGGGKEEKGIEGGGEEEGIEGLGNKANFLCSYNEILNLKGSTWFSWIGFPVPVFEPLFCSLATSRGYPQSCRAFVCIPRLVERGGIEET